MTFKFLFYFGLISLVFCHDYTNHGNDWLEGNCTSKYQSPINIDATNLLYDLTQTLEIEWSEEQITVPINKPDFLEGKWSKLEVSDQSDEYYKYKSDHLLFHTPSEHVINGVGYPLEMQIVHYLEEENDKRKQIAVLSIFFEIDNRRPANNFIDKLLDNSTHFNINMEEDLKTYVKKAPRFFYYEGSLTIPPCTTDVAWYILQEPIGIKSEQMAKFKNIWKENPIYFNGTGNNRALQEVQGRIVKANGLLGGRYDACGAGCYTFRIAFIIGLAVLCVLFAIRKAKNEEADNYNLVR